MSEIQKVQQMSIAQFFNSQKNQISAALPAHLNADRMLRIALTELRKNPKLADCTQKSLLGAIIQCSQLGLEPGNSLGHAYLIPYKQECQFMIGYRGMIDLARRSGQIVSINAHCVFENDVFEFEYGLNEKLKHVPNYNDRGKLVCAYAIAKLVGGGYQMEVMPKNEIDSIRKRSKSPNFGPWETDYEEMAKKTVIRKLFKYLPVSIEISKLISLDEEGDRAEQNNGFVIDGELTNQNENTEKKSKADELFENLEKENG